ncbi:MAG: hypothetical protein ACE361_08920 [Aureliella sp.]
MASTSRAQKILLLVASAVCITAGVIVSTTDLLEIGSRELFSGTLLKVGFVLGLAWVALPQIERLGWNRLGGPMLAGAVMVAILWSMRPRLGVIAGAIFVIASLTITITGWVRSLTKPPKR